MRILFFSFYNKLDIEVHPGVGILSSVLRKAGHETKLVPYFYYDKVRLEKEIKSFNPDVIAISATSMSEEQVKRLSPFIKKLTKAPILLGGVFAILEPEKAIQIEGIDAVCIGEGSKGFLEYVEGKHPATNYIYKDGRRGQYECWSAQPLDSIDYDMFWECATENGFKISSKLDYWTSYICEYGCSFCSMKKIRNVTGLKNKPRTSVDCAIENLKKTIASQGFKKVHLRDPLFLGIKDREWVKDFLIKYKKEINLPYTCNIRADKFDEEIAILLKETGCSLIKMGLESGSEYVRNKILLKGETDEQFITARNIMSKHKLRWSLNAMLGVPYETEETARETIKFLGELAPDKPFLHIFQPWPGLKLSDDIQKCIRYVKVPAIDDIVSRGHAIKEYEAISMKIDEDKVAEEYILTPILDQPQFPYELALKLQQEFISGVSKK